MRKTFEEYLEDWVKSDPENTGCYTLQDVHFYYDLYLEDGFEGFGGVE